jgi:cell division protein FtsL
MNTKREQMREEMKQRVEERRRTVRSKIEKAIVALLFVVAAASLLWSLVR